jgi:hypothetical protein
MANVSQIEQCLKLVLEARASTLARERGFIKRQRKWSRADLIRPRLSDRKAFEAIVHRVQNTQDGVGSEQATQKTLMAGS